MINDNLGCKSYLNKMKNYRQKKKKKTTKHTQGKNSINLMSQAQKRNRYAGDWHGQQCAICRLTQQSPIEIESNDQVCMIQ